MLHTENANVQVKKSVIALGIISAAMCFTNGLQAQVTAFLPNPVQVVSTVPPNGDVNPYGVAFVPAGFPTGGLINPGDILVSNYNNSQNLQGTGTTIVRITPTGQKSVFFQGTPGMGLSTALAVVQAGYVIVGNFPTVDGTCATAQAGSILVIDKNGNLVLNWTEAGLIDGPWDMTVFDQGTGAKAFVSNALSGAITRINLSFGAVVNIQGATKIAGGYMHRCDPAALVVAPTGLVFEPTSNILYVASTEDNAVFSVTNALHRVFNGGTGSVLYQDTTHLHGALAMALAPNGDLLVTNSDVINSDANQPSEIVEFTTAGLFVKELSVDPLQGGSFGLQVGTSGTTSRLAAVDDNASALFIWTVPMQ